MPGDALISFDEPQTGTASVTVASELIKALTFQTQLNLNLDTLQIMDTVVLTTSRGSDSNLSVAIQRCSDVKFRITWTALDYQAPIRHARSAADLYWVDPATNERIFITSAVGPHHDTWPTPDSRTLGVHFTTSDLEGIGRPEFDWKMHHEYFARFSFWSDRLPLHAPEAATGDRAATFDSLTATRTLTSFSASSAPNDVRFVFTRVSDKKQLSIWLSSTVLRQNCKYFKTLLDSHFKESVALSDLDRRKGKKEQEEISSGVLDDHLTNMVAASDGDSDYDLDELVTDPTAFSPPNPNLSYHLVNVVGSSYTAYRAVLIWIQTGYISFSPLLSSFSHLPPDSRPAARIQAIQSAHTTDPHLPLSASPKAVYKLAHFLDLPSLQSLALKEISRQLTIENVSTELFDDLASNYEGVRKLEVEFAVKNKREVIKTKEFKEVLEKLRQKELAFSGPVIADLLPLFVG